MAKRKKSYAETVSQAQLMAGALKANVTEVKNAESTKRLLNAWKTPAAPQLT